MTEFSMKKARLDRGHSIRQAADEAGVSKSTYARAEDGGMPRAPEDAFKIASYHGKLVTDIWPVVDEAEEPAAA